MLLTIALGLLLTLLWRLSCRAALTAQHRAEVDAVLAELEG